MKPMDDSHVGLGELILYVMDKAAEDPTVGATKLNKLLYFAEFRHFRETGRSITGATYVALPNGPAPDDCKKVRKALVAQRAARMTIRPFFGRNQRRITPLRVPNADLLRDANLQIVDEVVKQYWLQPATDLSELSHEEAGWRLAEVGREIQIATAYLPKKYTLSARARAHAAELASRVGQP